MFPESGEITLLALSGMCLWAIILLLPWRPWSTREALDTGASADIDFSRVTVLIPARNEADVIAETLRGLASQNKDLQIVLVDDQSVDQTAAKAREIGLPRLTIVPGLPLPEGWSGKLWALEQGRGQLTTELVLLLDADIRLHPGILRVLIQKLDQERLDLVSLMAHLDMQGFWGKLLIPAFIFFFKLLYPFRLSNSPVSRVAAAAGGCILVNKSMLDRIGAFSSLRDALIDDCALAHCVKTAGGRTWIGLTHSAFSLRPYHKLKDIWDMVARSAYTQLHYSPVLLGSCTVLMILAFLVPLLAALNLQLAGITALILMMISYMPVLRYYDLNPLWCGLLPVAGILFLGMTWSSAFRYWHREGATWKGRSYI